VSVNPAYETAAERRDGVSGTRLLWVGPLTVVVALLVNLAIRFILQALDPSLNDMGQLGRSLIVLTVVFAILAVIVFALMVWLVPHPIRWFRIVAVIAFLLSIIPDVLLGMGGDARRTGSSLMSPFLRLGALVWPPPQRAGGQGGGSGAPDVLPALPINQVLVLILLHAATAIVCVVLLTTLTREPTRVSPVADPSPTGGTI
jgi:hypothetical protein